MSLVHAVSIHKHLERMVLRSQETNPIGLADSRYSLPDQSAMARKQGHKIYLVNVAATTQGHEHQILWKRKYVLQENIGE